MADNGLERGQEVGGGYPHLPTSEATDHARRSLGQARELARKLLVQFHSNGENGNKVMLQRDECRESVHSSAQAAIIGYRSLASQAYHEGKIASYWSQELAEIPVPRVLVESNDRYADNTIEIDISQDRVASRSADPEDYTLQDDDVETTRYTLGLANMDWWESRHFDVRIVGDDVYYPEPKADTRSFKVLIPIPALQSAFEQINTIFDALGEGIQPQETERETGDDRVF